MSYGRDMDAMRDTFVANLLKSIMERAKEQLNQMTKVSRMLSDMQSMFLNYGSLIGNKLNTSKLANLYDEELLLNGIAVIAGDKVSMMYFISKCNKLSYQLLRPSPRLMRTIQLYMSVHNSWRYGVGLHMARWEEILEINSAVILKEVPVIRSSSTTAKNFIDKVKDAMSSGSEVSE